MVVGIEYYLSIKETLMNSKLYVGNLPYQTSETELQDLFTPFGTVKSAKVIVDRDTGRSKGFGFVEMGSENEAKEAIENLDGKENNGRNIRVNVAQEREKRPRYNNNRGYGNNRW